MVYLSKPSIHMWIMQKKNIFVMNENSNQLSPLHPLQNCVSFNTDEGDLCNNQGLLKLMII